MSQLGLISQRKPRFTAIEPSVSSVRTLGNGFKSHRYRSESRAPDILARSRQLTLSEARKLGQVGRPDHPEEALEVPEPPRRSTSRRWQLNGDRTCGPRLPSDLRQRQPGERSRECSSRSWLRQHRARRVGHDLDPPACRAVFDVSDLRGTADGVEDLLGELLGIGRGLLLGGEETDEGRARQEMTAGREPEAAARRARASATEAPVRITAMAVFTSPSDASSAAGTSAQPAPGRTRRRLTGRSGAGPPEWLRPRNASYSTH